MGVGMTPARFFTGPSATTGSGQTGSMASAIPALGHGRGVGLRERHRLGPGRGMPTHRQASSSRLSAARTV